MHGTWFGPPLFTVFAYLSFDPKGACAFFEGKEYTLYLPSSRRGLNCF